MGRVNLSLRYHFCDCSHACVQCLTIEERETTYPIDSYSAPGHAQASVELLITPQRDTKILLRWDKTFCHNAHRNTEHV